MQVLVRMDPGTGFREGSAQVRRHCRGRSALIRRYRKFRQQNTGGESNLQPSGHDAASKNRGREVISSILIPTRLRAFAPFTHLSGVRMFTRRGRSKPRSLTSGVTLNGASILPRNVVQFSGLLFFAN